MNLIEIKKNEHGGHDNISTCGYDIPIQEGWAVIPEEVGTPNTLESFPFGDIETEEIDGVMTVTKWVAGVKPKPAKPMPTEAEQLRADVDYIAVMMGVEL